MKISISRKESLYFDSTHQKPLREFQDIHQQILLAKFHESLTIPRGADSILVAGS